MERSRSDENHRNLFLIAATQAGYFTSEQALAAGYSRRLHTYHTHRGHWIRVERGIYRLREFPSSKQEDLARWSLWSRGRAVVSHDTAAAFHELGDLLPARVHLTVDPSFRRKIPPGAAVYRSTLPPEDIEEGEGFRVTTPLRTIMDLITSATEADWIGSVISDALNRGSIQRQTLVARFASLNERDRERAFRALAAADRRPLEV